MQRVLGMAAHHWIVFNVTELHTDKWFKMVNFMLCILYHNLKICILKNKYIKIRIIAVV